MPGRTQAVSGLPIEVPVDATDIVVTGPRPFITGVEYVTVDGQRVRWEARSHRKASSPTGDAQRLTWWIGLLFTIGASCFVLGPIPAYANAVGGHVDALTYFVGSLFFTTAAFLTYLQVVRETGQRWLGWMPRHLAFWAASIQLVGTVYFNLTTFAALFDVPTDLEQRAVWRPDALGSVCFLVASALAFAEAGHRWWSWRPGQRDWHITALNMWGSVFFGLSAIGAHVSPSGALTSVRLANAGTFLGAVCFLVAAVLMMPEGRPR